jgi:predicted lipoprotein with Yx(FWY)xxD motif
MSLCKRFFSPDAAEAEPRGRRPRVQGVAPYPQPARDREEKPMFRPMPLLVGAALALAALGGYDVWRGDPQAAPSAGPAPAAAAPAAAAPITLTTARVPLGEVVTSSGATLYRFEKDTAKPAKSTCAGQCAATWPPVLATAGAPQLRGIAPGLVGIVLRSDGTEQVTLAGWPLYRYTGDTAPGQTKGEGVAGSWHAVGPAGKPAVATAKSTGQRAPTGSVGAPPAPAPAPPQLAPPQPAPTAEPDPAPSGGGY